MVFSPWVFRKKDIGSGAKKASWSVFQDGSRRYLDFIIADRQSAGPLREDRRCTRKSITRPTANTTCSKPHLAAQAFRTERRYCGASNQHQGATVGRPCVLRRESCFVMDRNVLLTLETSALRPAGGTDQPQVNVSARIIEFNGLEP